MCLDSCSLANSLLFAQAPEIPFDSACHVLKLPANIHLGEAAGVATNSKGNILVYTRTGEDATMGGSRFFTHGGSRLFEFDSTGKYLREIGVGIYGFMFAQSVRVDAQDNIWTVDRGADVIIKFDPAGRFLMVFGRKPESVNPAGSRRRTRRARSAGAGNRRRQFQSPDRRRLGRRREHFRLRRLYQRAHREAGQDRQVHQDVGVERLRSRANSICRIRSPWMRRAMSMSRIWVTSAFRSSTTTEISRRQFADVGAPWAICISPGAHQYLYSSNSNPPDSMDNGEIYKMELDGKILGKFGTAGKLVKEFGTVNEIDCRNPNVLYAGELTNWRVQKLTLHP